jgi:hypothetical protein
MPLTDCDGAHLDEAATASPRTARGIGDQQDEEAWLFQNTLITMVIVVNVKLKTQISYLHPLWNEENTRTNN